MNSIHEAHMSRFTLGAQMRVLLENRSLDGSSDTLHGREDLADGIADLRRSVWAAEALSLRLDPNQRHISDVLNYFSSPEDSQQ